MHPEVIVTDDPAADRFEARAADGSLLGFAAYVHDGGAVVFTHTEVDEVVEGQGVGSLLARGALDQVRAAGRTVVPLCPFIRAYIRHHPEYEDLLRDGSADAGGARGGRDGDDAVDRADGADGSRG